MSVSEWVSEGVRESSWSLAVTERKLVSALSKQAGGQSYKVVV